MRFKEIDINIKAMPDDGDEELLKQLFGAKGVTVSDADNKTKSSNTENPGKVDSDDPTTVASVYPLQQELEMKKQEAGKDLAQFNNITQDADETAPDQEARVDEPLVAEPEVTAGENPGVPAEMKKKETNNENTELSLLKKLSGVI
jgi:ribosomal protein L11 methylase PrmA